MSSCWSAPLPPPSPSAWKFRKIRKIFRNIINSLPGFSPVPDGSDPDLLLLEGKTENASPPGKAAIIFAASGKPSYGAVTAERHPLTDGLNWSGLLIPSIGSMKPGEKAGVLLWQGESPLAWVDGKRLFLNWPWENPMRTAFRRPCS